MAVPPLAVAVATLLVMLSVRHGHYYMTCVVTNGIAASASGATVIILAVQPSRIWRLYRSCLPPRPPRTISHIVTARYFYPTSTERVRLARLANIESTLMTCCTSFAELRANNRRATHHQARGILMSRTTGLPLSHISGYKRMWTKLPIENHNNI
eukprot:549745-Pyramimonas_sp.AAC.2